MWTDPIVDEIRQTRARIWRECGESIEQLVERLKCAEKQHPDRLIRSLSEIQRNESQEESLPSN